jgi:DNA-binding NarL/FixJ family response regulator
VDSLIRIVVVDDNACMVWGMSHFIDNQKLDMEITGAVGARADLLQALSTYRPHVVLLEIQLEENHQGAELVRMVKENSSARVIVFTGTRDPAAHEKAVLAGAQGLVLKSEPLDVIVRAVKAVNAGELWLKRDFTAKVVAMMAAAYRQSSLPACNSQFTPSENRVIAAAVKYRGSPNKVIADALHMSPNTFRNHLSSIYVKLNIHRRLDLVLYGIKQGLTEEVVSAPGEIALAGTTRPIPRGPVSERSGGLAGAWRCAGDVRSSTPQAGDGISAITRSAQQAANALVGSPAPESFSRGRPQLPATSGVVQNSPVRVVRASLRSVATPTVSRR